MQKKKQKEKQIELDDLFKIFAKHQGKPFQYTKDTDEEEDLEADDDFTSFRTSKSYIKCKDKRIDFPVRSFFINAETSELVCWGHFGGFQFRLGGSFYGTGEFDLEFDSDEENVVTRFVGEVEVKALNNDIDFIYRDEGCKFKIKLDLDPFKGEFKQDGREHEMICSFDIDDNEIVGISKDPVGFAIWEGTIKPKMGKVDLYKQYILSHGIDFDGTITKDALPTIKGQWQLKKQQGPYSITQQQRKPPVVKPKDKKRQKQGNRAKKDQKAQAGRLEIGMRTEGRRQKKQKKEGEGRKRQQRQAPRKRKAPRQQQYDFTLQQPQLQQQQQQQPSSNIVINVGQQQPQPNSFQQPNQFQQQSFQQQPFQQQQQFQQQQPFQQQQIIQQQPFQQQQQFPQQQQQFPQQQQQQQFPQQQQQFPQQQQQQQQQLQNQSFQPVNQPPTVQQSGCCSIF